MCDLEFLGTAFWHAFSAAISKKKKACWYFGKWEFCKLEVASDIKEEIVVIHIFGKQIFLIIKNY